MNDGTPTASGAAVVLLSNCHLPVLIWVMDNPTILPFTICKDPAAVRRSSVSTKEARLAAPQLPVLSPYWGSLRTLVRLDGVTWGGLKP